MNERCPVYDNKYPTDVKKCDKWSFENEYDIINNQ